MWNEDKVTLPTFRLDRISVIGTIWPRYKLVVLVFTATPNQCENGQQYETANHT